jgi:molecular chaperone DnaJ
MAKDYYKILGVDKNATPEEIKAAFRRLAMKYHPDRGGDAEKFKEINEAYQVLSDPQKRSQYDQFGTTYEGMTGGPFSWEDIFRNQQWSTDFTDLGDIFSEFFRSDFSDFEQTSYSRRPRYQKGHDIQMNLTIDFRESVFGTEKEIKLYKDVICKECKGEGVADGSKKITCKTCGGSGQVTRQRRILFGTFQTISVCPECGGTGVIPEKKCPKCGGTGIVKGEEKLEIKIPAGISNGEIIRLSGKGEATPFPNGKANRFGDLYIKIRVKPDERFKREGFDILSEKEITFSQAALGATVDVETIDGVVELKIPAGIQSGTVIRLKNKGVPHLRNTAKRGDHLLTVIVKTPQKLSKEARRLMEELRKEGF